MFRSAGSPMSHSPTDIEAEVERHAAFVRGVALRLTLDPADAEDVVQQTSLAALEHRPEVGAGLRRWLGRVAANFALRMLRGDGRRRERERLAARAEIAAGDDAERGEIVERLTAAIAALDEPFRTAVILRYYDGLEPARIAARLGVPASTVRTRLKRGLDRMRDDLDRAYGGDRERWSLLAIPLVLPHLVPAVGAAAVAAAPVAAGGGGAVTSSLLQGVVLMSKKMMVAIGVVVLGTVAYVTHELDAWDVAPDLDGDAVEASRETPEAGARRATMPEDDVAEAPPKDGGADPEVAAARPVAAPPAPRAGITGRCVDSAGRAVADAEVQLRLHPQGSIAERGRVANAVRNVRADARGHFHFDDLPTRHEAFLRARTATLADANVRRSLDAAEAIDVGDLVLAPGGAIAGRVVRDGSSVEGASVAAWRRRNVGRGSGMILLSSTGPDPRRAETDAEGRFALRGLGDGEWMLRVTADGARPASRSGLHVENAGSLEGVEVELRAGLVLSGIVKDTAGQPVEGAAVSLSSARITLGAGTAGGLESSTRTTDAAGRFRFEGLSSDPVNITVVRAGFAFATKLMAMPSVDEYTIELEPTGIAWGRVRDDSSGRALDNVEVTAGRGFHGRVTADVLLGAAAADFLGESDPAGLFVVTGAISREVSLSISTPDHPGCTVRTPRLDEGARHELVVALERARAITGTVVDPGGRPVAGVRVAATLEVPRPQSDPIGGPPMPGVRRRMVRLGSPPEEPGVPTRIAEREVFTGSDGTFAIERLAAGSWTVTAADDLHAPARTTVDLAEDASATIELRLEAGGVVAGFAWVRPGVPFDGVRIVLEATGTEKKTGVPSRRSVLADTAGAFEIGGLAPGEYVARIDESDVARAVMVMMPGMKDPEGVPALVEVGRTTRIDITATPRGEVRGNVSENGRPVPGVQVRLVGSDHLSAFNAETAHTDEWGMFEFDRVEPGDWKLEVRAPMSPNSLERTVAVAAHRVVEETFELPTGVIRGRVADPTGKGIEGVVVGAERTDEDGAAPRQRAMSIAMMSPGGGGPATVQTMMAGPPEVRTDSSGRYELRHVPAGTWQVSVEGQGIIRQVAEGLELKKNSTRSGVDFAVEKGATLEVRLEGRLPAPGLGLINVTEAREGARPEFRPTTGDPVTFEGLSPGRYVITVAGVGPNSGELARKTLTIRPGKATVELEL